MHYPWVFNSVSKVQDLAFRVSPRISKEDQDQRQKVQVMEGRFFIKEVSSICANRFKYIGLLAKPRMNPRTLFVTISLVDRGRTRSTVSWPRSSHGYIYCMCFPRCLWTKVAPEVDRGWAWSTMGEHSRLWLLSCSLTAVKLAIVSPRLMVG